MARSIEGSMSSLWLRIFQPLIRPFARLWAFSYYGRPHCRFPAVRKDSWGIAHVICGGPPVDVIDVRGLEAVLSRLGDHPLVDIMPRILGATMDESGGVAVCEAHKAFLWEKITEVFDEANEEEQDAFKKWLRDR